MTFDVLGGVFRKEGDGAARMLLEDGESSQGLSVDKTSLSLPPPPNPQSATSTGSFTIDSSSQYIGYQGKGRLTISAVGSGVEMVQPNNAKDVVRQFSSLTIRFVFHKFAFNNACLGLVTLDGEIDCDVHGDYELLNQTFLGEAHCTNGPKINPSPLTYLADQKNYSVALDANLTIDGNIYLYNSYAYDGSITIDGEKGAINALIGKGGSCSL